MGRDFKSSPLVRNKLELVTSRTRVLQTQAGLYIGNVAFLADQASRILNAETAGFAQIILEDLFFSFMHRHKGFDQVRFLDKKGMEVSRFDDTDEGPRLTFADALQNKSDRPYFQKAIQLGIGGVYISSMNLNQDNGGIERPFNPILRLAAPTFDTDYSRTGVVVLNLKAGPMLDALTRELTEGTLLMTNDAGDWIIGPTRDVEWGMSLPDRKNKGLPALYPNAWKKIQEDRSGQFTTSEGLFTFHRVNPLDVTIIERGDKGVAAEEWILLSRVAPSELIPGWLSRAYMALTAALLIMGVVTWFWSKARSAALEAEAASYDNMKKNMTMSEVSLDALIMIDDTGKVQFWNKAAEKMFGYPEQESLGRNIHELIVDDSLLEKANRGLEMFARTGQGKLIGRIPEFRAQRRDGSSLDVELSVASFEVNGKWYAVGSIRDISERKETEQKLKMLASTDALTGLPNRRQFMDMAAKEHSRSTRTGNWVSIVMIDIDHFKRINDTWGHSVGDEALKLFAATGMKQIRAQDLFARLGGEEFALLLPETDSEQALFAAERLRVAVEGDVLDIQGQKANFTISLGVASSKGGAMNVEALLQKADAALYKAKEAGRNRVESG